MNRLIYWSQATQRAYSLSKWCANNNDKLPFDLGHSIIANGWAALDVLFDWAYNCASEGKAGSAAIKFYWDGTLHTACISQLPMKIPCEPDWPGPLVNGQCPFPRTQDPC